MTFPSTERPVKPKVLIADDSRIVRATLIKHIEGMFDFREALDGEQAWETLLLDPTIRVVITDLTMPKLDGYGLLARIRNSKLSRIRNLPVVVVSGSDEQSEQERARIAGATDLITKGIDTAQLLSRLDILTRLVPSQDEFERNLKSLAKGGEDDDVLDPDAFHVQAGSLLASASRNRKNFVVLNVCLGVRHGVRDGDVVEPPAEVVGAVGRLLHATVRTSDVVGRSGEAAFFLATGSINANAARRFAERVCRAIVSAELVPEARTWLVASCGVTSLAEEPGSSQEPVLDDMCGIARRRARLGLDRSITGVIGSEEERLLSEGKRVVLPSDAGLASSAGDTTEPDLATLLQWVKEGRRDEVLPHLGRLSAELQPLFDLVMQHSRD